MKPGPDLEIRTITDDEIELFARQLTRGFGGDPLPKRDQYPMRKIIDCDRMFAAFDGEQMIGTCAAFSFDLTIPGGSVPMGGTTMVSVQPTHRRRGALREMMRAHIEEVRERNEPLAGLWCSESSIYRQFGYGSAVELCEMKTNAERIRFAGPAPERSVRRVEPDEAASLLPALYDRVRSQRPGMFTRSKARWQTDIFRDVEAERGGRTALRFVVCEGPDGVEGYALYRQRERWDAFPEGEIHVVELCGTSPEASEALWRLLMNVDLYPNVHHWNLPVDDELMWRISEPRRLERKIFDSLWLRLLDIPRALASRRYSESGRCVIDVRDPFLPDNGGSYELTAQAGPAGAAECQRTRAGAAVRCEVDALAALYLGGHRATTLARAGRISGDPDSIALLDRMFAWSPLPWCAAIF